MGMHPWSWRRITNYELEEYRKLEKMRKSKKKKKEMKEFIQKILDTPCPDDDKRFKEIYDEEQLAEI